MFIILVIAMRAQHLAFEGDLEEHKLPVNVQTGQSALAPEQLNLAEDVLVLYLTLAQSFGQTQAFSLVQGILAAQHCQGLSANSQSIPVAPLTAPAILSSDIIGL